MCENKKRNRILSIIVLNLIACFSVFSLFLESRIYFEKFKLPSDIYEYKYGDSEYQILEGKETACIIGSEEIFYAVKKQSEWKVPFNEISVVKYMKDCEDVMIYVHEYNKSEDYYIIIYLKNNNVMVSDSLDSEFILVNGESYSYRTCVTNPDAEYRIYVNDKEYSIFK